MGSYRWDVVVVGGANTDYLVRGGALPRPGETVDGEEFLTAGGGKGANQAVAAARLGARVAFVGCVGRDARGDEMLDLLRAEGINVKHVHRHLKAETGVALVMVDKDGEKAIMTAPGANRAISLKRIHEASSVIKQVRVLLMQFELPMRLVLEAARIAHAAKVRVVLDPAPAAKAPAALLNLVEVVRPNAAEAKALTGVEVTNVESAREAARKLLAHGIKAAAVQAGGLGDLIVWRNGETLAPRLKVKTVDATGAGDAFAAGLAVGLAENRSYAEAGKFANAAAALATTRFGAQPAMPRRAEVMRLIRSKT